MISQTKEGLDRIDDFIKAIPNQYRFLELNMNHFAPVKDNLNYQIRDNFNYVLPLNKPYQLQKELYSKNLKRNLKKANLKGLQLFKNDAPKNLIELFKSETKYESGSGWPSFFQSLPDVFETKTDHLLGYARTEYHCKNCDAHHGHIFDDGPEPTGKRYCNNGVCLVFKPKN